MTEKIVISAPRFFGVDEAIREAFEAKGFIATLINYRTRSTIQETVARKLGITFPIVKPIVNPLLRSYLVQDNREFTTKIQEEKPDLLFIIKGDHVFPETLLKLKNDLSCLIVAYVWDDPFYSYAGSFIDDYRRTNLEKCLRLYDYIFVYDTHYVRELEKKGLKNVGYLPLAADPKRYRDIEISSEDKRIYGYDICFVGVPYPNRIEILEKLKSYHLGVFGDGWTKYFLKQGRTAPSFYRGKASGEKVLKIYRSSKIVLNIHDPEAKEGVNTRTFDILACGGRELVDYKKSLESHFKIGEEIITYRNIDELCQLVDFYCRNVNQLEEISEKGKQRVLREHTWNHRIEHVIKTLSEKKIFSYAVGA